MAVEETQHCFFPSAQARKSSLSGTLTPPPRMAQPTSKNLTRPNDAYAGMLRKQMNDRSPPAGATGLDMPCMQTQLGPALAALVRVLRICSPLTLLGPGCLCWRRWIYCRCCFASSSKTCLSRRRGASSLPEQYDSETRSGGIDHRKLTSSQQNHVTAKLVHCACSHLPKHGSEPTSNLSRPGVFPAPLPKPTSRTHHGPFLQHRPADQGSLCRWVCAAMTRMSGYVGVIPGGQLWLHPPQDGCMSHFQGAGRTRRQWFWRSSYRDRMDRVMGSLLQTTSQQLC